MPNQVSFNYSCFAIEGIQHAAPELKTLVKKLRNPFMNPGFALSSAFRQVRDKQGNPKLTQDLKGHVHPSLGEAADSLEFCTERFRFAVQILLSKYGGCFGFSYYHCLFIVLYRGWFSF